MTKSHKLMLRCTYLLIGGSFFLLPLLHAWMIYPLGIENHMTSYSALGGILPWSDAQGYYTGAGKLLETGFLDDWNIRRPLNAILFAMRLWITNNGFEKALILQALLGGISCLLVASCIHRSFGNLSGLITLLILFLFAAIFIPTTLSETLGLTLGCLGFVLLWDAVNLIKQKIHLWLFFTAGFILMVGLNARAGAFFILPFLMLWLGLNFKNIPKPSRFNWPIASFFILGVLGAMLFNFLLIKLNYPSAEKVAPHGNFSYVLFGLVSGGKNWTYAYDLYSAEIMSQTETEIARFLYLKSWEAFKSNPFLIIVGIIKNWLSAFRAIISFFCELPANTILKIFVRLLGFTLVFFSLFRIRMLYKAYKNEIGLISIALLGIFLSAGGIWGDGGFRLFAVTVPFFAAAVGISMTCQRKSSLNLLGKQDTRNSEALSFAVIGWEAKLALALSTLLLTVALLGPVLNRLQKPIAIQKPHCAVGETSLVVKNLSGAPYIALPLQAASLKKNLLKSLVEDKENFLKILESNSLTKAVNLALVYDLNTAQTSYILAPLGIFSQKNKWTGLCVGKIPGVNNIRQVQSFEALNEK